MQAEYSDVLPPAEITAAPMHRRAIACCGSSGGPGRCGAPAAEPSYTHPASSADTAEAMRAAQRHVLSTRRAAGQSVHPFYWAGFVALGDWR